MNELSVIVVVLGSLVNCLYGISHGQLGAFFSLLNPLLQLKNVDFSKLKADVLALMPADLQTLEKQFESVLVIPDQSLLLKIEAGSSALVGAIVLGEQVVSTAFGWYNQVLALIAKVKGIFVVDGAPVVPVPVVKMALPHHPLGASLPAWFKLPNVPSWLLPSLMNLVITVVLPALAVAFPAEAVFINELILFLKSGVVGPKLQLVHAAAHQP